MIGRRAILAAGLAAPALLTRSVEAANLPGVTATTLKIGNTIAYSGPASSYGVIGRFETAFWKMVNAQGGVGGRKIDFISLDDGYSPPKTVEQVRRLVEQDKVAFLFNDLGTPTNSAVVRYVNHKKVPHLFLATGASKWADYHKYPWTMGFQPNYRTEAQIYTKYILKEKPNAKIAILYQNDDFGKDYPTGVKDVLGSRYHAMVKEATYETTDPTVDSQLTSLQASGADVLLVAAIPKFAAQAIRKVYDLGWKPLFLMTNVSVSVASVMKPAGMHKGVGVVSSNYIKDPTDPQWAKDPGMNEWREFVAKWAPETDKTDINNVYAYGVSKAMLHVLQQCKGNFSRANILHQAESMHKLELPTLLPGITVNTSHTNHAPIKALKLMRWDGKGWAFFGDIIEGASS